ncbi:25537_t:CDS:2 [Gigaspora margarita]|uniref:25537_t:CDS:1 n=1 Tax=Gigaspora margarita TaxID=4874 RepID=A0ABM8VYV6_GIGMA|nr:25537_t:CDS:2 [Gigaspora margarita]
MNSFCREKFIFLVPFHEPNITAPLVVNTQLIQPVQQYNKAYNKDVIRILSLTLTILVVIVAICLKVDPVDSSILRNLTNTTSLISGQLAELNIPASSDIIGYRETSQYLADIIDRNDLSPNNSANVAQYLNQLGDKISHSGEAIEKMYPIGHSVLKEIGIELKSIINSIRPEQVLTPENVTYFEIRYGKILSIVTKLRDNFQNVIEELDELNILYNGTYHQLVNGINDVEIFFEKITPELEEFYDMEQLKRDLGYLKEIMKKVPNIRYQIYHLKSEFDKHRKILRQYRVEWSKSWRKKIVSFEDTEKLEEVIPRVYRMAEKFIKKDRENTEKRIYV